jgi:hypothetical protein
VDDVEAAVVVQWGEHGGHEDPVAVDRSDRAVLAGVAVAERR